MMSHLFLYKECGSLLILSFTSSIGKCNTALVILAIALFSRSWFPLFRILPQTASWYEWLPGGFFLQQLGEMEFLGSKIHSLEIVGYDPSTKAFFSNVYSNMAGVPAPYEWDVQGNVVTHWTEESKYTGTLSEDGNILSGGWRPEEGKEGPENVAYDATMTRMDG